jgi:hypothetical protein
MLNPLLLSEICRVFDIPEEEVGIVAENELGRYSCPAYRVPKFAKNRPKPHADVKGWGECYQICCPVCGDRKRRLFFSHLMRSYVKAKGETGTQYRCGDLYVCHNEHCNLREYIQKMDLKKLHKVHISDQVPEATSRIISWKEGVLPRGARPIVDVTVPVEVRRYLERRGYDLHALCRDFNVMFVAEGMAQNEEEEAPIFREDRILIPIIQGGLNVSWQARSVGDDNKRKYLFQKGFRKSECLYNMDKAKRYDGVVICEGITDVWKIGPDAVALFGKVMSQRQHELLSIMWSFAGSATVMLDSDAYPEAQKIAQTLRSDKRAFPLGVRVARLPSGDPGDYTTEELTAFIDEAWEDESV